MEREADLLSDPDRSRVLGFDQCDQVSDFLVLKSEVPAGSTRFGGISLTPELRKEAIRQFPFSSESLARTHILAQQLLQEAAKSQEKVWRLPIFDSPDSELLSLVSFKGPQQSGFGLRWGRWTGQREVHDLQVAKQANEMRQIISGDPTQLKAFRLGDDLRHK